MTEGAGYAAHCLIFHASRTWHFLGDPFTRKTCRPTLRVQRLAAKMELQDGRRFEWPAPPSGADPRAMPLKETLKPNRILRLCIDMQRLFGPGRDRTT